MNRFLLAALAALCLTSAVMALDERDTDGGTGTGGTGGNGGTTATPTPTPTPTPTAKGNPKGVTINKIDKINPLNDAPVAPPPQHGDIKLSDEQILSAGNQFVFTSNGISVRVRTAKWNQDPVDGCKRDVVFVIDNSGSMSKFRSDIFSAVNVAVQTLREKGNARVSTVIFSDNPYVYRDKQLGRGADRRKCTFCWQKSNIAHQPFPNPNKVGSGSLTDLGAAFTLVSDLIKKDNAGKGPKIDGPRIDPERPYWVILLSDLLVTKGMKNPKSRDFRNLRDQVLSLFCGDKWSTQLAVNRKTGELSFKKGVDASTACKSAVAEMHYFFFQERDPGFRDMVPMMQALKEAGVEGKPTIAQMDKAWREGSLQYHKKHKSWSNKQLPMYHLLSGTALPGKGDVYRARTTAMISFRGSAKSKYRWETLDFVKELLGEQCPPLKFDKKALRVEVTPMDFPTLQLEIDPVVRHFGNNLVKINPLYHNSLGYDSPKYLTESLQDYHDGVVDMLDKIASYKKDLSEQLNEFVLAANSPGSKIRKSTILETRNKVKTEFKRIDAAAKTVFAQVLENIKFAKVYIGGFASIKGNDGAHNLGLSEKRARASFCLVLDILNAVAKETGAEGGINVNVGYFGHKEHCKALRTLIGQPMGSCTDVSDLAAAVKRWAEEPTEEALRADRAQKVLMLEDEARRAEVHFSLLTAEDKGFQGKCCFAINGAQDGTCSSGGTKCTGDLWNPTMCADTAAWRENWEAQPPIPMVSGKIAFGRDLDAAVKLVRQIQALAKPLAS